MTTIEQLRDKYPAYLVEHAGDMTDYDIGAMAALLDKWTASPPPVVRYKITTHRYSSGSYVSASGVTWASDEEGAIDQLAGAIEGEVVQFFDPRATALARRELDSLGSPISLSTMRAALALRRDGQFSVSVLADSIVAKIERL